MASSNMASDTSNLFYIGIDVSTGRYVRMRQITPGTVVIDNLLSTTSLNPVTNQAITVALEGKLTTPSGGTDGQVLTVSGTGYVWDDPTIAVDDSLSPVSPNPVENQAVWSAFDALSSVASTGSYNDLTDKPTIPAEYVLPQATTTTLGGVMVDGSTITINNGVISAHVSVDTSLDAVSTNPVENRVITSALQGKASTDLATTTTAGLMSPADKSKIDGLVSGYLGYYATEAALIAEHPTGSNGQFANIGSTDTIWAWDSDSGSWVDTNTTTGTVSWANVTGKPTFATVASTGSYNDLTDKPTIPPAYVLPQATTTTLGGVMVDAAVSSTSSNPVANSAVASALTSKMTTPAGGVDGQALMVSGGAFLWQTPPAATSASSGYMAASDKEYLDYIHPSVDGSSGQILIRRAYGTEWVGVGETYAVVGNQTGMRIVSCTQAEYDALTTKDSKTLYVIVG